MVGTQRSAVQVLGKIEDDKARTVANAASGKRPREVGTATAVVKKKKKKLPPNFLELGMHN